MDGGAHILHHAVVDGVGAAGDGLHQAAPPRHRGEVLQGDALFLHRPQDERLPVAKLVEHPVEGLQVFRGVGDVALEQLDAVLEHRDLRGGAAGIDDQDLHAVSLTFHFLFHQSERRSVMCGKERNARRFFQSLEAYLP